MKKHQNFECLIALGLARPNPISRSEDFIPLGTSQELRKKIENMCEDCKKPLNYNNFK